MKIGRQDQRSSAISTSNADTIVVRGRDLAAELIGTIGFTEHFWLLLTGALPSPAQRRVLDATLVAIAEHGLVPSVQASRMTLAAAPEALQGAVAAGILGCGSVVLGSSEAAGRLFAEIARADCRRRRNRCSRDQGRPRVPRRQAADPGLRPSLAQGRRSARAAPVRGGARGRIIRPSRGNRARQSSGCCRSSSAGRWR